MKGLLPIVLVVSLFTSCDILYKDVPPSKTLTKNIDSLTKLRDSIYVIEKKIDSPSEYVYNYRSIINKDDEGIFWSKEIYHTGELVKGAFGDNGEMDVVEVLGDGKKIKDLK